MKRGTLAFLRLLIPNLNINDLSRITSPFCVHVKILLVFNILFSEYPLDESDPR